MVNEMKTPSVGQADTSGNGMDGSTTGELALAAGAMNAARATMLRASKTCRGCMPLDLAQYPPSKLKYLQSQSKTVLEKKMY